MNILLFLPRWIMTTVIWVCVWIPFYILGYLVVWVGLLFCDRASEHMPKLWWPWDNYDGINGTLYMHNLNWVYICNPDAFVNIKDPTLVAMSIVLTQTGNERKYGRRYEWCAFRNPVSNVSMYMIGAKLRKPVNVWSKLIGPFFFECNTSGALWYYGFAIQYSSTKEFYYGWGWKFTDVVDGIARFVYRISPSRTIPE